MSARATVIRGGPALVAAAAGLSMLLVLAYLLAGGSSYEPTPSADPCAPREWRSPDGIEESAQQFALSALDGAACDLGVTREQLAVALASEESRAQFATEQGIGDPELEVAVRAGLLRAIDDAVAADALGPVLADPLRELAVRVPVDEAIDLITGAAAFFGDAEAVVGGLIDRLEGLLP